MDKSCGKCIFCIKICSVQTNKEYWVCENAYGSNGTPIDCFPPFDDCCDNWSDNVKYKGKAIELMNHFIKHYIEYLEDEDENEDE